MVARAVPKSASGKTTKLRKEQRQRRVLAQLQEYQPRAAAETTGRGVFGECEAHRRRRVTCGEVPIGRRFQAVVPAFCGSLVSEERGDVLVHAPAVERAAPAADAICVMQ
tara:strand:- start:3409 stop:3738 length:330 start_codon:yes stop_codon:yes gene_type:complete